MFLRKASAALLVFVLSACHTAPDAASAPVYRSYANVHEIMVRVLDPATDVIWDSAGTVITADGRRELSPTSDEGWEHVRENAAIVSEAGNLLMFPGRSRGAEWDGFAESLRGAGELVMGAAEQHDADALFDAGGQLYVVCRACHDQYWTMDE